MNWLKFLKDVWTSNGRKNIVRELLTKYLTPERVTDYAMDGVNKLLKQIERKEKLDETALHVARAADLTAELATAIRDGVVTPAEAARIRTSAETLFGGCLSTENISALIEKVVEHV